MMGSIQSAASQSHAVRCRAAGGAHVFFWINKKGKVS